MSNFLILLQPKSNVSLLSTNPYANNKSVIQLKMLSGRYRTDKLLSHFQSSNPSICQLSCDSPDALGDLPHLLLYCSALASRRAVLFDYWDYLAEENEVYKYIINLMKSSPGDVFLQFILDCTNIPEIAALSDVHGEHILVFLFKITRTYCYSVHRERLKLLNIVY